MRAILVIHPSCPVSRRVVLKLADEKLLDSVELLDARDPRVVLGYGVWSVPWLVLDGVPAATDPVSEDEVVALLRGGDVEPRDPVEAFSDTLIHSSFAAAVSLINDDPTLVVEHGFVSAALRAPATRADVDRAMQLIVERLPGEWGAGLRDKVARALGVSFVRELYWARGGATRDEILEAVERGAVRLWLLGKASLGRGGLPWRPYRVVAEAAEPVERFVKRGVVGLLKKVEREVRELEGDARYWELLEKHLTRF